MTRPNTVNSHGRRHQVNQMRLKPKISLQIWQLSKVVTLKLCLPQKVDPPQGWFKICQEIKLRPDREPFLWRLLIWPERLDPLTRGEWSLKIKCGKAASGAEEDSSQQAAEYSSTAEEDTVSNRGEAAQLLRRRHQSFFPNVRRWNISRWPVQS